MKHIYLFACLLLGASGAAGAQTIPNRPIQRNEIVAAAKRQFAAIDANHDGVVTLDEYGRFRATAAGRAAAASDNPFQHVGSHWFEHADPNGTGRVTLDMAAQRPLQMFDQFDLNHDGTLGLDELKLARTMMAFTSR
ncbi:EF-hand domain-containing protein [Sphingomonas sp. BIUV-7]|uniref:EF-hand domain-containing protein n=1 Tax=Sphingomonas natans TaxID=3063330 RepID=A0ABT8YBG7_9SPHN|nr:EF-hand domain-containing protein [Sphingomonas sp. BIUV-7]MDO6415686.1 EF-hand domain-containing protein [Sphingomonas sp. BIUV-7]